MQFIEQEILKSIRYGATEEFPLQRAWHSERILIVVEVEYENLEFPAGPRLAPKKTCELNVFAFYVVDLSNNEKCCELKFTAGR